LIPNFVDTRHFRPQLHDDRVLGLPLQASAVRGINEAGVAARVLTRRLSGIEIHFVGPWRNRRRGDALVGHLHARRVCVRAPVRCDARALLTDGYHRDPFEGGSGDVLLLS